MAVVQKRLHISGFTPAISEDEIRVRLQNFVNVRAIDGFGKMNALGEPRRFAYATVEATEQNLARCFNYLSGTVWKGAKLRIGEAKPDYRQRLESEREHQEIEPPNKRRRLPRGVQGVHAKDMSLVTTQNVDSRPGWYKTTLSHLIRPMKMRPSRPLPAVPSNVHLTVQNKPLRKVLYPLTRARIQKIDPRSWNSIHLTEQMLQSIVIAPSTPVPQSAPPAIISATPPPPADDAFLSKPSKGKLPSPTPAESFSSNSVPSLSSRVQRTQVVTNTSVEGGVNLDIRQENARHLALLSGMFDESSNDWNAPVEDELSSVENEGDQEYDDESQKNLRISSLSRNTPNVGEKEVPSQVKDVVREDLQDPKALETKHNQYRSSLPSDRPVKMLKGKSLKDLFKPQEDAGFSLMAGLDLDLDLDLELGLDPAFSSSKPTETHEPTFIPTEPAIHPNPLVYHHEGFTLDSDLPFFFPRPDDARSYDIITIAKTQGSPFYRTDDSEAIRQRWDDVKGDLTHEWKKRSREAVKARKRRFGAEATEDS